MKHLLLLPPLVLATASGTLFGACNLDESSQVQSLDEETRVVTLDIAGMT